MFKYPRTFSRLVGNVDMKSIQVAQLVAICDLYDVLLKGFVSVSSFPSGTASSGRVACIITGVTSQGDMKQSFVPGMAMYHSQGEDVEMKSDAEFSQSLDRAQESINSN